MRGKHVCYYHGGKSRDGIFNPAYRHGRYSKYLPTHLRATYEAAVSDPALLELRAELALCDTRLSTLLQQLDIDGAVATWQTLSQTLAKFRTAQALGELPAMREHLDRLTTLITTGGRDGEVWTEVYTVIETRRRLSESEHKRLVAGQHMLTAERATLLVNAILATVKEQVVATVPPEFAPKLLANLSSAFSRLALLDAAPLAEG